MTTDPKEKQNVWSFIQLVLFIVGCLIACVPIFSMDYLITLDGPNHLYSSRIAYELLSEKGFYSSFFEINDNFTPNYFTILILGGLQQLFSGVIALKIFHLFHIILLISGMFFWSNAQPTKTKTFPFLLFPFVYSYLFFSGFYNFIFAASFALWTLGFYDRFKANGWSVYKYIAFGLLLLLTYCSHVIPFFFAGLYLFIDILMEWKKQHWSKKQLKHGLFILLSASPGLLLTLLFMGSRQSEYNWLETSELISRLTSGFSIVIKPEDAEQGTLINWIKLVVLGLILMLFIFSISRKESKKNWSLPLAALVFLFLYFTLPDSVGYASVFSVRIEYIFWLFVLVGATHVVASNKALSILSAAAGIGLLVFQVSCNLPYWKMLNGHAKSMIAATDHIDNNSVIYPVFNSLVWDDFHISNLMGTSDKQVLILENTSARQDYFPLIYKAPYEECIRSSQSDQFSCIGQELNVDYLLIVGKYVLDPSDTLATKLYEKAYNNGEIVYEDDFTQLLKFSSPY